ncbi:MAG: hypothetical protein AAF487_01840 [Bacteroidota bacterium]
MYNKKLYLSICILFFIETDAQVIKGFDPDNDLNKLIFNEEYIAKNRIKKINGKKSFKKRNDIIRDTENIEFFEFKKSGMLENFGYTSFDQQDTVCQFYEYANQLVINEGISNRNGESVDAYEYDEKGRPIKKSKIKYYSDLSGQEFKTIISEERIKYNDISDSEWKATYFNSYGKAYKSILKKYDSNGFLLSENENFLIGNRQIQTIYTYDEKGFLLQIEEKKENRKRTSFKYNAVGELVRIENFKNDELINLQEFFYDRNTALLSSSFSKEEATGLIHIVKYDFEFY